MFCARTWAPLPGPAIGSYRRMAFVPPVIVLLRTVMLVMSPSRPPLALYSPKRRPFIQPVISFSSINTSETPSPWNTEIPLPYPAISFRFMVELVSPENWMAYPSPLLDEKVLSETIALETSGPQMDPSAVRPVPSAVKMLLFIFKPLAPGGTPAAPTEIPIVALPVVSSSFQEISTFCGAFASWTRKVVLAPLSIEKPSPLAPPRVKSSPLPWTSTTKPLLAVKVVLSGPLTLLSVMSGLSTMRFSSYVPAETLMVVPPAMSIASWICAALERTFTVVALPLRMPPVLRSASRSTKPLLPTLSMIFPLPELVIAALTAMLLLSAVVSSFR